MTFRRTITIDDPNRKLNLDFKGINAVKIKVNGKACDTVIWNNSTVDLSNYLKCGENEIELTIYNNLRNLLGPHHLEEGECLNVRPCGFFKERSLWTPFWMEHPKWDDDYCFAEVGLFLK